VTAVGVSPSAGTTASSVFALTYESSAGASDLRTVWAWFNTSLAASSASSCLVHYDRVANRINLLNDGGTVWQPAAPGAAVALQNSQCAIDVSASSVGLSGDTLTVWLAVTFKGPYAGAKNIYMFAANGSGSSSGWEDRGDWIVPQPPVPAVTADAVSPHDATGSNQTFTLTYSSNLGAAEIDTGWVWFSPTFASSAAGSCLVRYDAASATLALLNDAGTAWQSAALGANAVLQNSQCSIALSTSSAVPNGNTVTLTLPATFAPSFSGVKNIFMFASGTAGASAWHDRGEFTVIAGPQATITADAVNPGSGSGANQLFALEYSSDVGADDLRTTWVWFNATFATSSAGSCLVYYERPTSTLFLLNDAGTQWMPATIGSGATLQNGQCTIELTGTSVGLGGNTLTLNLNVTFAASFAGTKNVYMFAANASGRSSGWVDRGDWSVP
jgi:hypothetical protein